MLCSVQPESNDTLQCAYSELDSSYYVPEPTPPALSTIDFSVPVPVNATTVTPTATMASTELATNDTLTTVERPKDKCTPLYVLQVCNMNTFPTTALLSAYGKYHRQHTNHQYRVKTQTGDKMLSRNESTHK